MPNFVSLAINRPVVNVIIFNDSFGSGEDFIEDGSEPSSSHSSRDINIL